MLKKIRNYAEKWHMLEDGDKVIVGVSGGADSICLLLVLMELQREIAFEIIVVHVNHGLRGAEADADEQYVKELCEKHQITYVSYLENIELIAKKRKQSTEEAGREVRREAFYRTMKNYGGTKIALAHHKNDNVETFMMNLARGTGLKGLGGIRPVKGNMIRPLLCVERSEIEQYLEERETTYCVDQTNKSDDYTRNRIRNHIIPYFEQEVNAKTISHVNDTMEYLQEIQDFMEEQTKLYWETCIETDGMKYVVRQSEYQDVPKVIQPLLFKEVLRRLAGREKDIESIHLNILQEMMDKQSGRKADLPYEIEARKTYLGVEISKKKKEEKTSEKEAVILKNPTKDVQVCYWGNKKIQYRIWERGETGFEPLEKVYTKWFDYDIIKGMVSARTRKPGDYITINQMGGTQKLKSYFINEKIPQEKRDDILVIAEESHILWISGYRVNSAYQVNKHTKQILEIQIDEGEKIMAETIKVLVSEKDVDARIEELGRKISEDYAGKEVHLICVLKGSVFFMCELAKRITVPVTMDFMSVSSYGDGTSSSGVVKIAKDLDEALEGKDVLVVEDIIDSGRTLYYLLEILEKRGPKSMKLCTLLDKPERRVRDVKVDYVGFNIPDEFVVGYGLDYAQKYRNLPYIGVVEGVE